MSVLLGRLSMLESHTTARIMTLRVAPANHAEEAIMPQTSNQHLPLPDQRFISIAAIFHRKAMEGPID